MWPLVLLIGASVGGTLLFANKVQKDINERIRKCGGMNKINSVELVSANYKGRRNVKGPGIPIRETDEDWDRGRFYLKVQAAEHDCDIVLNVTIEGTRKDGFHFSGIAYKKA